MNEIMNYIFGNLKENEIAMRTMAKKMKGQARVNRMLGVFVLFMGYRLVVCEMQRHEQAAKLKRLEKEMDSLKWNKGE